MGNLKKVGKYLGVSIVVLFIVIVAVGGGILASNVNHLGRLYNVWQLIHSDYLENVTAEQLVDGAMDGIVNALNDPYSQYLDAEENQQLFDQLEGRFGGVGIILSLKDPSKLIVLRPIKNGPAVNAGIQGGDQIIRIDDVDASTLDQDAAVALMRGEPGTKVTLEIYRESTQKTFTASLTRDIINVPTVEGTSLPGNPDLAYINISQFSSSTGQELGEVMETMNIKKYKGVILDMRYNHGGELNAAVEVASHFVTPGPVVYIVDKKGNTETKSTNENFLGIPLVVLVNEETASAAEIVSGAIKDRATGTLVGTKTFGKGIVQTIFPLDNGTSVKLTTAKYLTPNKTDIHKIGIEPDVKIELEKDQQATLTPTDTKFDAQLSKAVEVLKSKI